MAEWTKLKRGSSWDYAFFLGPGGNDARHARHFVEGSTVQVRWPDQSETVQVVQHKKFKIRTHDMGHEYDTEYSLAGFMADCRGVKVWLALDEVEVLL